MTELPAVANNERNGPVVSVVWRQCIPEEPARYTPSSLAVVREMLEEAIEQAVGDIRSLVEPGQTVVLKPNAMWYRSANTAATTDPRVVRALVEYLRDSAMAARVLVVEGPLVDTSSAEANLLGCGILRATLEGGGECVFLDGVEWRLVSREANTALKTCLLPRCVLDADVYISVPKLKVHALEGVSLGLKNQMGLLRSEDRLSHHHRVSEVLVDLLRFIKPSLTVIDGIWVLQGRSAVPSIVTRDVIRDLNVLVCSRDVVSADATAAR
jgi:uncharacterized protein (DUF362 family)